MPSHDTTEPRLPGVTTRRIPLSDVTLNVAEAGPADGAPIVLLHGFPEFWWGMRRQITGLAAQGFRVIAPDQRGYGLSDKPTAARAYGLARLAADVAELIEATAGGRAHLVGHDWGGVVAFAVGALHSERLSSLTVINAPHLPAAQAYARRHLSQARRSAYVGFFQLPVLPELALRARDYRMMRRALRGSSRPGTFPREDLEVYVRAWSRPGALTAMLNWYRGLTRAPCDLRGRPIPVRTQMIWGGRDRFLEQGLVEASLARCAQPSAQIVPDATHWVHLEEPARVTALIAAHVRAS